MDATETHALPPREPESFARRAGERALLLAKLAAVLARTPPILPRSPQDQALVSAGAGLMGAAYGLLAEVAVTALVRVVPAGRRGASTLLGGLALAGLVWGSREGRTSPAVDTASRVLLVSGAGGELALAAYRRLPGQERTSLWRRSWTTALAAATAIGGLRQRLAEPRDLVKASIRYDVPPTVSGGEESYLPLATLDRERRKFLEARPPGRRPEVVVYGESLGAQVVAETFFEGGVAMLKTLDIARGALIGVPYEGARKLQAVRDRGEPIPEGLGVFADVEDLAALAPEEQRQIRYLLFDLKNGIIVPPVFGAYAHDCRLELPRLLRVAFGHGDAGEAEIEAIERATARRALVQEEREARGRIGPRA